MQSANKPNHSNNSTLNVSGKAAELSLEHLVKSIETSTTTVHKEIFYYNFSLIGLQLYILNKTFDIFFQRHNTALNIEILFICIFVCLIVFLAILSTTNLLQSYQLSRENNFNILQNLIANNVSSENEKNAEIENQKMSIRYKRANLLCKINLHIFFVEIIIISSDLVVTSWLLK
jgi:hypothetical protein